MSNRKEVGKLESIGKGKEKNNSYTAGQSRADTCSAYRVQYRVELSCPHFFYRFPIE